MLVLVSVAVQICLCQAKLDPDSQAVAQAIVSQSGLHLPASDHDMMKFFQREWATTTCEEFDVHWMSATGPRTLLPIGEPERNHFKHQLSIQRRTSISDCDPRSHLVPLQFLRDVGVIVLGATASDEIRSIHLFRADPRTTIVECPQLSEKKVTPGTKCGAFTDSEILTQVRTNGDPDITRLVFLVRVFTAKDIWHFERIGDIPLPPAPAIAIDVLPPMPMRLGSPINVTVTVDNITGKDIYLASERGVNGSFVDYRFLLTKDGREVPTTFFHRKITGRQRPDDPSEVYSGSSILLSHPPGRMFTMIIDLTRLYEITEPGSYVVSVSRFDEYSKTAVRSKPVALVVSP